LIDVVEWHNLTEQRVDVKANEFFSICTVNDILPLTVTCIGKENKQHKAERYFNQLFQNR
jgi:hypothetical protein